MTNRLRDCLEGGSPSGHQLERARVSVHCHSTASDAKSPFEAGDVAKLGRGHECVEQAALLVGTLIQRVLGARNDPREVIDDPHACYFGAELNQRSLVAGDEAELGEIRFDDWLGRTARPIPNSNVRPAAAGVGTGRSQLKENVPYRRSAAWIGAAGR